MALSTIYEIKEREVLQTPLLLFDCVLRSGEVERWSTSRVNVNGSDYRPVVLTHNLFEVRGNSSDGIDSMAAISIELSNVDSYFSQIERQSGWKGARLDVRFVFFDLGEQVAASDSVVVFHGIANSPESIGEKTIRLSFQNRFSLQRVLLPKVRIERRCPWQFPRTAAQRQEASEGGGNLFYSPFYACGYSPDVPNGRGNMPGGAVFESCDFTRSSCEARGMFAVDDLGRATKRFGGVEYVPSTVQVRTYGDKSTHLSALLDNQAKYNDFVPLVYGTAWYTPPVVFARNDGNLTHFEILLGLGEMEDVLKVVVNDLEIPAAENNRDMTGTGWFKMVSHGGRDGVLNADFSDASGKPLGDPYGSLAYLSLVTPNRVNDGGSMPKIQVLVKGMRIPRYDESGNWLGIAYSNNPSWVLLDVLRRAGWEESELDIPSFAMAAAYCEQEIAGKDPYGNNVTLKTRECNLVLRKRQSAAEVVRGIRNGAGMLLSLGPEGKLILRPEESIAIQQPTKHEGSNSVEMLAGGWPMYEFGDGSNGFTGILRANNGSPKFRLFSRPISDCPNRLTAEFQDSLNEFQQDSVSVMDLDDVLISGQEVAASIPTLGLPNTDQAMRILRMQLAKSVQGNTYVEFSTSVRAMHLKTGDIITITYFKEGLERAPFRIVRLSPSKNYETISITAQAHADDWYDWSGESTSGAHGRNPNSGLGLPRPLIGSDGGEFQIQETISSDADGNAVVMLSAGFNDVKVAQFSNAGVPVVGLSAAVSSPGGSITGDQTLYYAISGVDENGSEGGLSFSVRAVIPAGSDENKVLIGPISLSPATTKMRIYRGKSPRVLSLIAEIDGATTFLDDGRVELGEVPPDSNFDHANFYWRLETVGIQNITAATPNSVTVSDLGLEADSQKGNLIRLFSGRGAGQERRILGNTGDTLTIAPDWQVVPDDTSKFAISEPSWKFGAEGKSSPIEFEVPARGGNFVQITGRSSNANDTECPADLCPVTRWRIGIDEVGLDTDVPPQPDFALGVAGSGTVEINGISFETISNTRTITAATLSLYWWDELSNAVPPTAQEMAENDAWIVVTNVDGFAVDDLVQMDGEIASVEEIDSTQSRLKLRRGSHGSSADAHQAGTEVRRLERSVHIVALKPEFFGTPASGSYQYRISLPDVKIGAAELYMSNRLGNSPVKYRSFGHLVDEGLRTLRGGQITMQVEGYLGIAADSTPPFVVDRDLAIGDVFAVLREAPTGAAVQLEIVQDEVTVCALTIPAGQTYSNTVTGNKLSALRAGSRLRLNIVSVPDAATGLPGRDLTVVVRV